MSDIHDALARGFRYPTRPGGLDAEGEPDDPYDDDHDTEVPRAPLSLAPAPTAALTRAHGGGRRDHGCDNTLRAARAWARREKVRWGWLRGALEERGGFCDCEVLLNVLEPPD